MDEHICLFLLIGFDASNEMELTRLNWCHWCPLLSRFRGAWGGRASALLIWSGLVNLEKWFCQFIHQVLHLEGELGPDCLPLTWPLLLFFFWLLIRLLVCKGYF